MAVGCRITFQDARQGSWYSDGMTQPAVMSLMLFAKLPQAGKAKTRLIPAIGAETAARFAEACLKDLLSRLAGEVFPANVKRVLCFDPPSAAPAFREMLGFDEKVQQRFELLAQGAGDLGRRLAVALTSAAERNGGVVFIGADAPDLPMEEIQRALRHISAGNAYLQRATDGGYVLLGLPRNAPAAVFENIRWSSKHTADDQLQRLKGCNLNVIESGITWCDVDESPDLHGLRIRLEENPQIAPRTLELLRNVL
jgi:uncharacterized protein